MIKRFIQDLASMVEEPQEEYTADGRNLTHLKRFFAALEPHHEWRNRIIAEYEPCSNITIPQFDVSREVMPDIFSYSGYAATDVLRKQDGKNEIVSRMLSKSLEEPAVIIDIGTFDGRRTKEILSSVKNKENIQHVIGIDTNPIIHEAEVGYEQTMLQADARHIAPLLSHIPARKIYLGLENVLMNMTRLGGCQHQGLQGFLAELMNADDDLIFEVSHGYNPDRYTDGVEDVFHHYFEKTGLKDILGGKLSAHGSYELSHKLVLIEDIKESVEFMGERFDFPHPEITLETAMGQMTTDAFSEPYIHLGVSQSLDHSEVFSTLMQCLINYLVVEKEEDWQSVNDESIVKMTRDPDCRTDDSELHEVLVETAYLTETKGLAPLFRNYSDVMIGLGNYPAHYNRFINGSADILWQEGISGPVKHFLNERSSRTDRKAQSNMTDYIPHYLFGGAEAKTYDPMEGMPDIHSFIKMY